MSIWGKIIGGTAGFALGGPIGAILGAMAGHSFDKRSSNQKNSYFNIPNNQKQNIYALSVIILSAKLAKSDGVVTKDEVFAFKEKFNISKDEMETVGKIFNEAKKSVYGFEPCAKQVYSIFKNNHVILEELLSNLFYIAEADGHISDPELKYLMTVSNIFNFDQKTFDRIHSLTKQSKDNDPYKILGIDRNASDEDVRNAWLKLSKNHHPDYLISQGMPKEFIEQANIEMSSINAAYDRIQKMRK